MQENQSVQMQENQSSLTSLGFPQVNIQFPEHEQLRCPRCDSNNTKFCYYNNYNLSQPRHFCKNCRRYWTKGGTLRNIPVGGGCRKNSKRPAKQQERPIVQNPTASAVSSSGPDFVPQNPALKPEPCLILEGTGIRTGSESFTSLLGLVSEGQFCNFIRGPGQDSGPEVMQGDENSSEGVLISGVQNEWPNLAINTTSGSKLH